MAKIIKLYMEDEINGFCFDEAFVKRVHKQLKDIKKKDCCEKLLCATIVAEFLAKYEIKTEIKNVIN